MPHVFFISYAREDQSPFLDTFLGDLVESVRIKAATSLEETAFRDQSSIPLGGEWPSELVHALQGCRVFVPILTRGYFKREPCGREWAFFRNRQDAARPTGATRAPLVIPVLWGALRDVQRSAPRDVLDIDLDGGDFGKEYLELGMDTFMRQRRFEDQRQIVIAGLARRIQDLAEGAHSLPPLAPAPSWRDVKPLFPTPPPPPQGAGLGGGAMAGGAIPSGAQSSEVFRAPGGPRYVQFVIVAASADDFAAAARIGPPGGLARSPAFYGADPLEWTPYRPDVCRPAGVMAVEVAASRDFYPTASATATLTDEQLIAQLKALEERNAIAVLLVDTWTLRIERYQRLMQRFDQSSFFNTAVVVVLNDKDGETVASQATLDSMVKATFFRRSHGDARTFTAVRSAEQFKSELAGALDGARRRLMEYAAVQREVGFSPRPTL